MKTVREETEELISILPEVNSVSAYGSGYFKQEDTAGEKKSMDLIISVDNPSLWHIQNMYKRPEMYVGTNWKNMINLNELQDGDSYYVSFPNSISCFFTTFGNHEYKLLVVDKRLLYRDLKEWEYFSLAGRFQKETELLVDNSGGVLPELMKFNYESAEKVALLMKREEELSSRDYLESIVRLSYLGDLRKILHFEDPNKIPNIVDGSYDFLHKTYILNSDEFYIKDGSVYKNEMYNSEALPQKVRELPKCLRNYLVNMRPKELDKPEIVEKEIRRYFRMVGLSNSIKLMLRCNQTVGKEKSRQTFIGKFKKGMQKVKK